VADLAEAEVELGKNDNEIVHMIKNLLEFLLFPDKILLAVIYIIL